MAWGPLLASPRPHMLTQFLLPRPCHSVTSPTCIRPSNSDAPFLIRLTNKERMAIQLGDTQVCFEMLMLTSEMTSPPSTSSARHSFPGSCLPALSPATTSAETASVNHLINLPPIICAHDVLRVFGNQYLQTQTSPLGGFGCFAAKDLSRGDVILRERPLLVANDEDFYKKFGELAADERTVFEALSISPTCIFSTPRIRAISRNNR